VGDPSCSLYARRVDADEVSDSVYEIAPHTAIVRIRSC
jgi:hypothetical protein